MPDPRSVPKTIDKRIRLLVDVLRKFPGLEIVSSSGGYKKTEGLLNPVPYHEFYVDFICLKNSSDKIIPIIKSAIAPYSDKVTLERDREFEEIIKDRLIIDDTVWTMKGKEILPDIIVYNLLKEKLPFEKL